MNLELLCTEVRIVIKEVANFISDQKIDDKDVQLKSKNSLVSYVDQMAEKKLVQALSDLLPEAGFIAEEGTVHNKGEIYDWIIDPLDGTTNFIHSLPFYSISVALKRKDDLVLGVVYELNMDEMFYAWEGSQAYLNGKEIIVSTTSKLENSLLGTGFPYYDFEHLDNYLDLLKYFMSTTRGIRRMGSAATDLAYVACGRFDGFFEYALNSWDVAAGIVIVRQAGGIINDFRGGDDYLFGREIIASNYNLQEPLQKVIRNYLGK